MIELHRSLRALHPRHVADTRQRAIGRAQLQVGETGRIAPDAVVTANDDRNAFLTFGHDPGPHALDLCAQRVLELVDRHPEPPRRRAVDVELEIVHIVVGDRQDLR